MKKAVSPYFLVGLQQMTPSLVGKKRGPALFERIF
jgi:hypothetical protein